MTEKEKLEELEERGMFRAVIGGAICVMGIYALQSTNWAVLQIIAGLLCFVVGMKDLFKAEP